MGGLLLGGVERGDEGSRRGLWEIPTFVRLQGLLSWLIEHHDWLVVGCGEVDQLTDLCFVISQQRRRQQESEPLRGAPVKKQNSTVELAPITARKYL